MCYYIPICSFHHINITHVKLNPQPPPPPAAALQFTSTYPLLILLSDKRLDSHPLSLHAQSCSPLCLPLLWICFILRLSATVSNSEPSQAACLQQAPTNAWLDSPDFYQPGALVPEVSIPRPGRWGVRGGVPLEVGTPQMILDPKVINVLVLLSLTPPLPL